MKNDRLIAYLLKQGKLVANPETGEVHSRYGQKLGTLTQRGYLRTSYMHRRRRRVLRIHRIIWISVHGIPAYGMEVDHRYDEVKQCVDKTDNRVQKLELVTSATNCQRAHNNGQCGYDNHHNERTESGQFKRAKADMEDMEDAPYYWKV